MPSLDAVSFGYDGRMLISDLHVDFTPGNISVLLGPSGCGKSTLLRLLAGLETPNSGAVKGVDTAPAFVFQDAALLPWASVEDNVALPSRLSGEAGALSTRDALQAVGLADYAKRKPAQLSGGQRMRVSIARALATHTNLVLFDEPFAALDEILRFQLNDLLLDLQQHYGWTVVFVTHSLYEAAFLGDRIAVMHNGTVSDWTEPGLDRSLDADAQRASAALHDCVKTLSARMRGRAE